MVNDEIKKTLDIYGEFSSALDYPPSSIKELLKFDLNSKFSSIITYDFFDLVKGIFDWDAISVGVWNYLDNLGYIWEKMEKNPEKRRDEVQYKISVLCDGFRAKVKGVDRKIKKVLQEISKKNFDETEGLDDGLLFLE